MIVGFALLVANDGAVPSTFKRSPSRMRTWTSACCCASEPAAQRSRTLLDVEIRSSGRLPGRSWATWPRSRSKRGLPAALPLRRQSAPWSSTPTSTTSRLHPSSVHDEMPCARASRDVPSALSGRDPGLRRRVPGGRRQTFARHATRFRARGDGHLSASSRRSSSSYQPAA